MINDESIERALIFGSTLQELENHNKITFTLNYAWDKEISRLFSKSCKEFDKKENLGKYNYYSEFAQEFLETKEKEFKKI